MATTQTSKETVAKGNKIILAARKKALDKAYKDIREARKKRRETKE